MRIDFLEKYATNGKHYDINKEIDKALDSNIILIRAIAIDHNMVNKEHLDKALNDPSEYVRANAALNTNGTKEHLDKALKDENFSVHTAAKNNKRYKKYYS